MAMSLSAVGWVLFLVLYFWGKSLPEDVKTNPKSAYYYDEGEEGRSH